MDPRRCGAQLGTICNLAMREGAAPSWIDFSIGEAQGGYDALATTMTVGSP